MLLHAIAESILGALALGDLGKHFPDTDDAYKGMDSLWMLKQVYHLMGEKRISHWKFRCIDHD